MAGNPRCKDCVAQGITSARSVIDSKTGKQFPGPRCRTHHLAVKKQRRVASHGNRIENLYGITRPQYDILLEKQGGKCYICRKATGATKALAVDHDHKLEDAGLPKWMTVRAIVCGPCNQDVLGRLDVAGLLRAAEVLMYHPAQETLERLRGEKSYWREGMGSNDSGDHNV